MFLVNPQGNPRVTGRRVRIRREQAASHHDFSPRSQAPSAPAEKSFGVTFGAVFILLAIWLGFRSGPDTLTVVMAAVAIAFLVLAFIAPTALGPLNRLWFRFGLALHAVISPIILGLLFFGVVTPI